jgi:6-phosphogluconolactonase (cycloisomerase 2 family)
MAVPGAPFPAGRRPRAITVAPSGRFAYVGNDGSDSISGFRVNPTAGSLTPIPGSPFPAGRIRSVR